MTEYDQRQYKQMQEVLESLYLNPHSLRNGVASLGFLTSQLEKPNIEWLSKFRYELSILDQVYAALYEEDRAEFYKEEEETVLEAIVNLQKHVAQQFRLA